MDQSANPSPPSRELSRRSGVCIGQGHVQTIGQAERPPKLPLMLNHSGEGLSAAASQPQGQSSVLAHIAAEVPHLTANPQLGNTVLIDHLQPSRNSETAR